MSLQSILVKPSKRKCQCGCRKIATSGNGVTVWASIDCAIKIAQMRREKAAANELRERKAAARPLRWYLSKAGKAVNAYIRERDKNEPCISCGRWHDGQWHAGHFNSVGSHPELRFEYDNIHKQCQPCNAHKGGNRAGYEPRLIAKIGQERVDWLIGPHTPAHFTREQLLAIEVKAKLDLRALLAQDKLAA